MRRGVLGMYVHNEKDVAKVCRAASVSNENYSRVWVGPMELYIWAENQGLLEDVLRRCVRSGYIPWVYVEKEVA